CSGGLGYVESTAMGLLAGINAARLVADQPILPPPAATALGALIHHLTATDSGHFQPSNVNFGLFPPLKKKMRKRDRGKFRAEQALDLLKEWQQELDS
ncbi:MAG: methylenetetrahydrofolate--tRNA-(uracil(54)-C(5))-methyltransferase (FADH(2)-oxidizing) TrmFO, partial [Candidatus Electrothrix sp. ATG1]|nr:methylenetetrahydrofolate--tRNA-(uracil(54)-C(5))-methyltransferase (FADH(2)-oxidizing) TrmFO [Candidatus Electrothrix sp. ATG1]